MVPTYLIRIIAQKQKEGVSVDHGKYIVVYRRVGGRWMLHRDMSTSSVPPK
jgi:hypothetical protein